MSGWQFELVWITGSKGEILDQVWTTIQMVWTLHSRPKESCPYCLVSSMQGINVSTLMCWDDMQTMEFLFIFLHFEVLVIWSTYLSILHIFLWPRSNCHVVNPLIQTCGFFHDLQFQALRTMVQANPQILQVGMSDTFGWCDTLSSCECWII